MAPGAQEGSIIMMRKAFLLRIPCKTGIPHKYSACDVITQTPPQEQASENMQPC